MVDVEYKVNNIVLTVSYKDSKFNLEKIASNLEGARYDPEVFPGVVYRKTEPKASFLIFESGEVNCLGTKSIEVAEKAIEGLTERLKGLGFDVREPEVEVQNMVASADFHRRFDLERIARNFRNAEYEPEVFPGLIFRMEETSVAFLLFVEGNSICVGAKSEEEIQEGVNRIAEVIE
ncbi:hypothetical protein AKJ66_02565 [candidate division MSBL1 archaeon SCGC-AAA259E22]|uniref:TATA-box-binding protein n=1 Tax=candidate division MSBL1 archaeon SCGC-AAA259E22 TaxID=1698265 RepID=A0A133UG91_9EURY|nr:hypothetical protein AKJ66_02565 [candidate division MSBL1 archaeon SCGC-AAA259E22]